jgi:hypothetical protein
MTICVSLRVLRSGAKATTRTPSTSVVVQVWPDSAAVMLSLADAHHAGRLQAELIRLGRYPLLVVDEVGYIPFESEAANLFFQLVSSHYERDR